MKVRDDACVLQLLHILHLILISFPNILCFFQNFRTEYKTCCWCLLLCSLALCWLENKLNQFVLNTQTHPETQQRKKLNELRLGVCFDVYRDLLLRKASINTNCNLTALIPVFSCQHPATSIHLSDTRVFNAPLSGTQTHTFTHAPTALYLTTGDLRSDDVSLVFFFFSLCCIASVFSSSTAGE